MPMSIRRPSALGASRVCSVESTRWPVSAASTAMCAVSRSRISPTMITSGSARSIERSPTSKVTPALGAICICLMPAMRFSTGSSIVRIQRSPSLSACRAAYSVVDFPDPVGPVTSTAPLGRWMARVEALEVVAPACRASRGRRRPLAALSRMRMTTPSPLTSGSVTTRMSTRRPSTVSAKRPSCGTRRSEMSRSAMILMRETTPIAIRRLTVAAGASTPSTRNSTLRVALLGVHVDVGGALLDRLGDDRVHELDDGRIAVGLVDGEVAFSLSRRLPRRRCPRSTRPCARGARAAG